MGPLRRATYSASVSTAAFVGQLTGVLVDGGTASTAAVGLASNVATLANIIRVIVEDVKEKSAANQKMRSMQVISEIFDICPLVGAYLILCVPTSVMLNTVFDRIARSTSMAVEHRFVIPALTNYPGMFVRNEEKLEEMEKRKGKTGMEGFGSN